MINIFIVISLLLILPNSAIASECTDFLSVIYSKNYNSKIQITEKNPEITERYEDYANNTYISSIVYGNGSLKQSGKRKQKIIYICTMKDYKTPTWGYILPR